MIPVRIPGLTLAQLSPLKTSRTMRRNVTLRKKLYLFAPEDSLTMRKHISRNDVRFPPSHSYFMTATFSSSKLASDSIKNGFATSMEDEYRKNKKTETEDFEYMSTPNPGLASVISQGMKSLEQSAAEIQYKTRKDTLSQAHKKPSFRNGRAAEMDPRQLAEGQRILDVASECLEHLALQDEEGRLRQQQQSGRASGSNGLIMFGEPIVLLECEVNRNVRQARIYWTLPYGILLDNRINQKLYQEIMVKVQNDLVANGGAKLLAREVHNRLSYYYPPRIKLYPATDEMVQKAIEEYMM